MIQTLRDLRETGDDITRIEGIFSGTLAYLFNVFDGSESFSSIVRAAKRKGYTEPDPRDDLSGMDVARKLIILGREMGLTLEMSDVEVAGLVPEALDGVQRRGVHGAAAGVRRSMAADARARRRPQGQVLRYVGRVDADGKATVGLTRLDAKHAFANIALTDNVVRFATRRYCDNPLIVQGPGSRSRSDRRRRVLGSVAPVRVSRRASVDGCRNARADRRHRLRPRHRRQRGHRLRYPRATRWTPSAIGCGCAASRSRWCASAPSAASPARSAGRPEAQYRRPRACRRCMRRSSLSFGFEIEIEKGIPLASGMGGSAASAVAAVVAANALLEDPSPPLAAAQVRDGGGDRRERLRARRQYRALPVRGAGAHGGHRSSAREADPRAALAALRARASAHAPGDARGARHAEERRHALGFRLADARISRASSAAATRTIWT